MLSKVIVVDPQTIKPILSVLSFAFLMLMESVYGLLDIVHRLNHKKYETERITTVVHNGDFDKPTFCKHNSSHRAVLNEWISKENYRPYKRDCNTILNTILSLVIGSFWIAHLHHCCRTFKKFTPDKKKDCAQWTQARCREIEMNLSDAHVLLKLAPDVRCFLKDISSANLKDLVEFFDQIVDDIVQRNIIWVVQYGHCRFRSRNAEQGVFAASIAVHALFSRCQDEMSAMHGGLLNKRIRLHTVLLYPLNMYVCEKCVVPYKGDLTKINATTPELLQRTLQMVSDGHFRRQLTLGRSRGQYAYRDNLIIDLSFSASLGFIVSECPIAILERMVWIADKGNSNLCKKFWVLLKDMKKSFVADLRKCDVHQLIYYSVAGVVQLSGNSDSFFRLIGNEEAPLRLRCLLPKPTFEDLLQTGLAKDCGDSTYMMCDIPGVTGHFKGVHIGPSLLIVKCAEKTRFNAKRSQAVL